MTVMNMDIAVIRGIKGGSNRSAEFSLLRQAPNKAAHMTFEGYKRKSTTCAMCSFCVNFVLSRIHPR